MTFVEGEGQITFAKDELPPLADIGFWSVTVHDENVLRFSSAPEEGNWLYTPGGKMAILIRSYQSDPEKIASYIPPAFEPK